MGHNAGLPCLLLVAATVPQTTYTNGEARCWTYLSPIGFRIGHYPTLEEEFWLVHGIIKSYPLREGLDQVLLIPFYPPLWIRIRMFLGLPDPHPDPLVTITDPDPSIIKQK
jgi:hypothetical protein